MSESEHTDREGRALDAAGQWLDLLDRDDIPGTWQRSAALFRAAVTTEQWGEALGRAQALLGKPKARSVRSSNYATELPGAPDGEYVVVEYDTEFERKKSGTETVALMLDPDGEWRVSGYFVR